MNRDPFAPGAGASFYDFLAAERPDLLPAAITSTSPGRPIDTLSVPHGTTLSVPHGTTVLALTCAEGVVIAGDRMASDGMQVSSRRVDKVIQTDSHSALAISGAVGPCLEMAKLFTTELEYFEKIEGRTLSLSGKANKLGQMVRGNLTLAMQGLAVIPLFAGYDLTQDTGRVFKYDAAGGRTEEPDFVATGSGGDLARSALKRAYRPGLSADAAVTVALSALLDAADDDLATAGPDPVRKIYPTVMVISASGGTFLPEADVGRLAHSAMRNGEG